jgi:predicted nucleotide-binding protein
MSIQDSVRPNVFIGSSSTAAGMSSMGKVAQWLDSAGAIPHPWTDVFPPGTVIFSRLNELRRKAHGAAIILTGDDQVTSDFGVQHVPRGNVLIELGLFVGSLGPKNAIVCISGEPLIPADLSGLVVIELSKADAPTRLERWAKEVKERLMGTDIITPEEAQRIARLWRADNMPEDLIAKRLHRLGYPDFLPLEL